MFTEPMLRLFAIVPGREAGKVTEALLMSGSIQFISSYDFPEDATVAAALHDVPKMKGDATRITDVRRRIEQYLATAGVTPDIPAGFDTTSSPPAELDAIHRELDTIAAALQKIRDQQRLLQNNILKYEEIQRQTGLYGEDVSAESLGAHYSYVFLQLGSLPADRLAPLQDRLQGIPAVMQPVGDAGKRTHLIVIAMKRDRERVAALLAEENWEQVQLAEEPQLAGTGIRTAIDDKLSTLRSEQRQLQEKGQVLLSGKVSELTGYWTAVRIDELRLKIRSAFKQTTHTVLFSGWVPVSQQRDISTLLQRITGARCHLEWLAPGRTSDLHEAPFEAPVKFDNPKLFAPFEMLVSNFGIPEYGTIDPTPFVVVTYLTMFGLMFADIGQGAVVAAAGIAGVLFFGPQRNAQRTLSSLLIWCGASSMFFGTLFGSLFGFEVFKPLWFDFHGIVTGHAAPATGISSIYDILGITVKFGISVIACGIVFNWINLVIKRRWYQLTFDKGGILGGWIYAGGIYTAVFMINHDYKSLPDAPVLLLSTILPALLLFIKAPLHAYRHHTAFSATSLLNFLMEWIVELLEVFGGYLSNTLSFMRVAGLGIAHVSLMMAFFTIADMVRGDSPGLFATLLGVLFIVAGNIMVIALEGLSAGIQALRLNYYEFFTKFFHGTGTLYRPVSLKETTT